MRRKIRSIFIVLFILCACISCAHAAAGTMETPMARPSFFDLQNAVDVRDYAVKAPDWPNYNNIDVIHNFGFWTTQLNNIYESKKASCYVLTLYNDVYGGTLVVPEGMTLILELNNKKINTDANAIVVRKGARLLLLDGFDSVMSSSSSCCIVVNDGGALYFEDGTIELSKRAVQLEGESSFFMYGDACIRNCSDVRVINASNDDKTTIIQLGGKAHIEDCYGESAIVEGENTVLMLCDDFLMKNCSCGTFGLFDIETSDGDGSGFPYKGYADTHNVLMTDNATITDCKGGQYTAGFFLECASLIIEGNAKLQNLSSPAGGFLDQSYGDNYQVIIGGNATISNVKNTGWPSNGLMYLSHPTKITIKDNATITNGHSQLIHDFGAANLWIQGSVLLEGYDSLVNNGGSQITIIGCRGIKAAFGTEKVTINGGAYDRDVSKYLAGGLSLVSTGGTYGYCICRDTDSVFSGSGGYNSITEALKNSTGGLLVLLKDVTDNPVFSKGTYTLNLNGHTLSVTTSVGMKIEKDAEVTITDESAAQTGLITNTNKSVTDGKCITNAGTLNFVKGVIQNGTKSSVYHDAAAVVNSGSFTMSGASRIANCYCRAAVEQPGTSVGAAFTMTDNAQILSCMNKSGSASAAGVIISTGKFTMKGSSMIQYCQGDHGGVEIKGVVPPTFVMTDNASITNCQASGLGGGIFASGGNLTIEKKSKITNCLSDTNGGAIYISAATLTIKDDVKLSGGTGSGRGNVLYIASAGKNVSISGNPYFSTTTNSGSTIYKESGSELLKINCGYYDGGFDGPGSYAVSGGNFTGSLPESYIAQGYAIYEFGKNAANPAYPYNITPSANIFTIIFHANDGSNNSYTIKGHKTYGISIPVCPYSRDGYVTKKWTTGTDGSGTAYKSGDTVKQSMELYAIWEIDMNRPRTITYKDTTRRNIDYVQKIYSDKGVLETVDFTSPKSNLVGWNTKSNGNGSTFQAGTEVEFGKTLDITLYAEWQDKTISLVSGSGKVLTFVDPTGSNPDLKFTSTQRQVKLTNNGFFRNGYIFAFWSTKSNPTGQANAYGKIYYEGSMFTFTNSEQTLYANWKEKSLTDYNTTGDDVKDKLVVDAEVEEIEAGEEEQQSGIEKVRYITYHDNSSYNSNFPVRIGGNSENTLAIFNPFVRFGFVFDSWNTEPDGSGTRYEANSVIDLSKLTFTDSNADLYAIWSGGIGPGGTSTTGGGTSGGGGTTGGGGTSGGGGGGTTGGKSYEELKEEIERRAREAGGVQHIVVTDEEGHEIIISDAYEGREYSDAVAWALKYGITEGQTVLYDADGNVIVDFGTLSTCTRAHMVTFIWRACGCPEPSSMNCKFTDVVKGSYYEKAVIWATELGIVNGTSETTFTPNNTCTRAHALAFVWRTVGCPAAADVQRFADVIPSKYYYGAVNWGIENGVINNYNGTMLYPDDECPRSEIVTYLYEIFGKEE